MLVDVFWELGLPFVIPVLDLQCNQRSRRSPKRISPMAYILGIEWPWFGKEFLTDFSGRIIIIKNLGVELERDFDSDSIQKIRIFFFILYFSSVSWVLIRLYLLLGKRILFKWSWNVIRACNWFFWIARRNNFLKSMVKSELGNGVRKIIPQVIKKCRWICELKKIISSILK